MKEKEQNIQESPEYTCKNPFCLSPIDKPDPSLYSALFCDKCKHFIIDDKFRARGNRTKGLYKLRMKVTQEYLQEIIYRLAAFIDNPRNSTGIPSIKGFCAMNKISHQHLVEILGDKFKEVGEVIEILKDTTQYMLSEKMVLKFNPGIIFYLKQFGWKDIQDVNNNTTIEPIEFRSSDDDKLNETIDRLIDKRNKAE